MKPPAILYCHCQYAQVLPKEVKQAVLQKLCDSGQPFEAVPDLCELSARRDPALARLAAAGPLHLGPQRTRTSWSLPVGFRLPVSDVFSDAHVMPGTRL